MPKAATRLFAALGYASDRHIPIATPKAFFDQLDQGKKLTERERETLQRLTSFHLLFQLTDAELTSTGDLFDDPAAVQKSQIHSYLSSQPNCPPDTTPALTFRRWPAPSTNRCPCLPCFC